MTRPFRFGVQTKSVKSRRDWVELVRKIEDRGYTNVTMPDHFDDQLDPGIALMAAADVTESLRIGALVWCNDYRHPVVFAKEAATLDLLSEGRLELAIGAGWMTSDYVAAGIELDRPGVRIERLEEAVAVLKGLFGEGAFSFQGKHYQIAELDGSPKPVQKPHPPFLIGGGGPRMLRAAGRLGDIVGVNPNLAAGAITAETAQDALAERFDEKIGWVRDGAGERFDDIELQLRTFVVAVTDNADALIESMTGAGGLAITPEQAKESPLALVGSPAKIADDLRARRERYGFSYIIVSADELDDFAPVVAELAGT